jgi:hypothetical protein
LLKKANRLVAVHLLECSSIAFFPDIPPKMYHETIRFPSLALLYLHSVSLHEQMHSGDGISYNIDNAHLAASILQKPAFGYSC